ncbi:phosphatidate cytidylyltransferase [Virgibacillus sp. 179-BFC.A HS]|uniref:Phosphatidate cytidylyltransferase n=1 Tax=Tigheibacillus jepli TaxID=3035914 RepID=A0ABU5CHN1_9BACI|nr:phosphatidate cytidylyltransferase [Virgibacillus sp. 179-BFC.A HS]MDY0405859.1 phosphatidate cytidylyltransferase [Virgibacillus sp. 179-BFC.A HS]
MKQRIITAILAMIVFIPFVLYGHWPFILFVYFLASVGLYELMRMKNLPLFSIPSILGFLFLWALLLPEGQAFLLDKSQWSVLFVLLFLAYTVLTKNRFTMEDAGFSIISIVYVAIGFYYFMIARTQTADDGLAVVFLVLFIVWATDTGAYFIGKAIGKHKLWPEISPNKTVEGAAGGILLACIVGLVFQAFYPFPYNFLEIAGIAILISIVGQMGDLVESAFKRHFDVKDSGNLLPGHGGILDRLDSVLFVFPVLYLIQFIG